MKRKALTPLLTLLLLAGCSSFGGNNQPSDDPTRPDDPSKDKPGQDDPVDDPTEDPAEDPTIEFDMKEIQYGDFSIATKDGQIAKSDNVYTLSKAGTYDITGTLTEGNINVEAGDDDEVIINLNDVCITSALNSPIFIKNADKAEIHVESGKKATILDKREVKSVDDDTQGNGAITAKCDLEFSGKGDLEVAGYYNNGIHSTKDLEVKNIHLNVVCYNDALKGKDSVEVKSGNIDLISTAGDGIATEDTDVSSKGNQRGTITIEGGITNIYCCCDGLDASYDAVIQDSTDKEGNQVSPELNIYTSKYSAYSVENPTKSETEYYIKTSSSKSDKYRISILCYTSDGKTTWADAEYEKIVAERTNSRGGQSTNYNYYSFKAPSEVQSFEIYLFDSSKENSTTTYLAKSEKTTVNANYDTLKISYTTSEIKVESWTSYSSSQNTGMGGWGGPGGGGPGGGPGGMDQGNTNKSEYSSKGIKADNSITISGGKISIKSFDDAIHANYGTALENGSTGAGDVFITGGDITLFAADDAIHGDDDVKISGGTINITEAYEAIEGSVITISGGDTTLYATDDGLNAAKKSDQNAQIIISGGKVDVTVGSGDTDGIDSNGTFKMTGGIAISRGSGQGGMSTGLDCDGTAQITGGTFLCFGKPEKTPSLGTGVKSQTISGTFGTGTYTFTCGTTTITTTNKSSHSGVYIYSDVGNSFSYKKV